MRLYLQKPSLMVHLAFQEIPFRHSDTTVVLLCQIVATQDLQYNYIEKYLASVL